MTQHQPTECLEKTKSTSADLNFNVNERGKNANTLISVFVSDVQFKNRVHYHKSVWITVQFNETVSPTVQHTFYCMFMPLCRQWNMLLADRRCRSSAPMRVTSLMHQHFIWPHGTNMPLVGWWPADVARSSYIPVNKNIKFQQNLAVGHADAHARRHAGC